MVRKLSRKTIITGASVLFVLLATIGTIALLKNTGPDKADPYRQPEVTNPSNDSADSKKDDDSDDSAKPLDSPAPGTGSETPDSNTPLDPSTVSTIDIEPMEITVSYIKGVGGFEFEVLRTPRGTEYVEFRNSDLVGTKCTNDQGAFASILANPHSDESATLTKQVEVGGTTYGLSLATDACTGSPDELKAYQTSFTDAFSLIKKLD